MPLRGCVVRGVDARLGLRRSRTDAEQAERGGHMKENTSQSMGGAIEEVLFSREVIAAKVDEIAGAIAADYAEKRPLVVGILNGCFPFIADLVRAIDMPLEVDFMAVSSYGGNVRSSGVVRTLKDLNTSIEGRHVLLVEDIVDTGLTLRYLIDNLMTRHPASLQVCALLDKAEARTEQVDVAYTGFPCPSRFVVGYGLDYDGLYRNLPYIGVLAPQVYGGS
jgi:hypoxanthine phosphoribosyltransferase